MADVIRRTETPLEKQHWLVTLTIDGDAGNTVDPNILAELSGHLDTLLSRPDTAVVLTGEGRHLSTGSNLDQFLAADVDAAHSWLCETGKGVIDRLYRLRNRLVVAGKGVMAGAGAELALVAGRLLIAKRTRLWLPEVTLDKRPCTPAMGGTVYLARRMGGKLDHLHTAAKIILTGMPLTTFEIRNLGVSNGVYPMDQLLPAAQHVAEQLLRGRIPPHPIFEDRYVDEPVERRRFLLPMQLALSEGLRDAAVDYFLRAAAMTRKEALAEESTLFRTALELVESAGSGT